MQQLDFLKTSPKFLSLPLCRFFGTIGKARKGSFEICTIILKES